jgi:arylformamidase
MDQQELDDAYNQSVYAPNMAHVSRRLDRASEAARRRLPPRRVAYGNSPIEALDIYLTPKPDAPINVFIHGGAWRAGLARDHAFAAEMFVNAGAHQVVVDFINVEEAGGNLMTMADQVRRAVAWVYRNSSSFGGDRNRLFVAGHSSGGHLAAVAMTTDWQRDFNLPADIIKGGVCASGMFDLKPVRLSARSKYVNFTDEIEEALSPQRHLAQLNARIVILSGTLETPEFQRQARDFSAAVKAAGKPVELIVCEGYNHFEVEETFASPYGLMGRAALQQMKLTAA